MIKVTYGTTTSKQEALVSPQTTIRAFCEDHDINYDSAAPMLDGRSVTNMDKTFAECGITTECRLLSVVKSINA